MVPVATLVHIAVLLAAVIPSAMATSVRAVYLITVVNLDPFIVGSFNYATSFLGILLVYYAGRGHIDRLNPANLSALTSSFAIMSALCILAATASPFFLIAAAILSALASIGGSIIFLYDERYGPRGQNNAGLYRTRLLLSVAWIVGPPLSFVLFWLAGFVAVTIITSALAGMSALAMIVVSRSRPALPTIEAPVKPAVRSKVSVLGFWPIFIVMVATTCANVLHSINMPLYLIETLRTDAFWPGFVMASAAGIEVVVIALLPRLTGATSDEIVLWSGLILGVVYFALLSVITDPVTIMICQLLYGAHFAATTVVCLPLLRRAMSGGTGSLAAQFNNAGRIGGLIGSASFAVLAERLGYHGILTVLCPGLLILALIFGVGRWAMLRFRTTPI
jgi:MFS transporter, SET family, sugar efflux transporter